MGYIGMDQARVLAMRRAGEDRSFYGPRYGSRDLVWEVTSAQETEDYYDIKVFFRPATGFRGDPGLEEPIIDKTGVVAMRQILNQPRVRNPWLVPSLVGGRVVLVGAVAAALAPSGIFDPPPPPTTATPPTPVPPLTIIQVDPEVTEATGIRSLELKGIPHDQLVTPVVRRVTAEEIGKDAFQKGDPGSVHSYLDISLPTPTGMEKTRSMSVSHKPSFRGGGGVGEGVS